MVATVLEAHVQPEQWAALANAYTELTESLPDSIVNSWLLQDQKDASTWRILTLWRDQESLDRMRQSGQTPTGIVIFQRAQAQPALSIFDVRVAARR